MLLTKLLRALLEAERVFVAVLGHEVLVQAVDGLAPQHVARDGVGQHVDHAAAGARGRDAVGKHVHVEADAVVYAPEGGDHLQRQYVLPAVVAHLEDGRLPHLDRALLREPRLSCSSPRSASSVSSMPPLFLLHSERRHERGPWRGSGGAFPTSDRCR